MWPQKPKDFIKSRKSIFQYQQGIKSMTKTQIKSLTILTTQIRNKTNSIQLYSC
jgi:hypothetical protein